MPRNPYSPALLLTIEDLSRLAMEGKGLDSLQTGSRSPPTSPAEPQAVESPQDASSSEEQAPPVVPKFTLTPVTATGDDSAVKEDETESNGMFVSTPGFGGNAALDYLYKKKKPVAAVFVHAGAGYHSHTNESLHLQACAE